MPQFVRYLIVGALCAALEFISFLFFHEVISFNLVATNTIAYVLGLLSSFLLNKFWVFVGKQKHQTDSSYDLRIQDRDIINIQKQFLDYLL